VTAQTTSGQRVDIDISALQNVTTPLRMTVPVLEGSTPTTVTTQNGNASYTLSVPTGTPRVRSSGTGGISYPPALNGDYFINAQGNCTPASETTPFFSLAPGASETGKNFNFTACTGY
jgi:hypothetical protein